MIETFVSNIFIGNDQAYIYIWVSKNQQVIYVGMTNDRVGTLGRASAHLSLKGTLRKKFLEWRGFDINNSDDWKLLTFPLPKKKEYISVERSYREAIEFLVQTQLQSIRGALTPTYDIISWVRYSPRTNNIEVKKIAKKIVKDFTLKYPYI